MDREKLSQLQIWEYYKYSELCALLGEPEKQGNSKKAQEKEWARYFEFEKIGKNKGTRYIVDDIYDVEKRKIPGGNSKYIQMIESLVSYVLFTSIVEICTGQRTEQEETKIEEGYYERHGQYYLHVPVEWYADFEPTI